MISSVFKQLIKPEQIIAVFSFGYLGVLFAGKTGPDIWLLVTLALMSAKTAHLSLNSIHLNSSRGINGSSSITGESIRLRERINPEEKKENYKLWFLAFLASAIFIFTSFMINQLCYYLSIAAVTALASIPIARKYGLFHGVNFRLFEVFCPVGGFIASYNRFEIIAFILAFAVVFRSISLRIATVINERQTDKEKKNYFINHFGLDKAKIFSIIFFFISVAMFAVAGIMEHLGLAYWITVLCYLIITIRLSVLLNSKDADIVKNEFFQINDFVAPLILIGALIDILFR